MPRFILSILLVFQCCSSFAQGDSTVIHSIYRSALEDGKAYEWLDHLCNKIGPRLSGSDNAAVAVKYVQSELRNLNPDSVWLQDIMVPHWVRGTKEQAWFRTGNTKMQLSICALGGSIATPAEGLKAKVIEVHNFDELTKLGHDKVSGKIVFMNHPMKPGYISTFEAYGEAAGFRLNTARNAAALGAVGAMVRSMTLSLDDYPHTGILYYNDSVVKIPGCALSTVAADKLSEAIKKNADLDLFFQQSCNTLPDVPSANVVAEIKGWEHPEEIILIGGHLDSWDLAQGAQDDGAGVVQSMEVLQLMKKLNLKPRRTIRCIAFMNEENGSRGGIKYAELSKVNKEHNIAAIETDAGGYSPRGFSFKGDSLMCIEAMKYKEQFTAYNINEWTKGYGGADINYLEQQGTLLISLLPDSQRYFDVHHAASDTFDKVNRRELELGAASIAALAWLIAENGVTVK